MYKTLKFTAFIDVTNYSGTTEYKRVKVWALRRDGKIDYKDERGVMHSVKPVSVSCENPEALNG